MFFERFHGWKKDDEGNGTLKAHFTVVVKLPDDEASVEHDAGHQHSRHIPTIHASPINTEPRTFSLEELEQFQMVEPDGFNRIDRKILSKAINAYPGLRL